MNNYNFSEKQINEAISFDEYYTLSEKYVLDGQTSGPDQSEMMIDFTKLNFQRLKRNIKTNVLQNELVGLLNNINSKQTWLVLVECWCGDVAQNLPIINLMVQQNELLSLKLIFRDENLDIIDAYLTNGGRSIPKLIMLDNKLNEIAQWGPRPAPMQQMTVDYKNKVDKEPYNEFAIQVHKWYAKDKTQTIQAEFINLLSALNS